MKEGKVKMKKQEKENKKGKIKNSESCQDKQCPFHGKISIRGRTFQGKVIKKFPRRICIEFERTIYIRKYERYMKKRSRIHARLSDCLADKINIGDYVEIKECRPLSKIIHFVVIKKLKGEEK